MILHQLFVKEQPTSRKTFFLMLFKRGQVFSSPELDQFFTECLMLTFNIHLFSKIANVGMENIYGPDGLNGPDGQDSVS